MNTNGDQSQLLKQLVINHAANFNNQQQTNAPTTTNTNQAVPNMTQQGIPTTVNAAQQGTPVLPATSSDSMYDLSLNNSQRDNSQNLNSSIPNTFQSPGWWRMLSF